MSYVFLPCLHYQPKFEGVLELFINVILPFMFLLVKKLLLFHS